MRRLVAALPRLLDPADALAASAGAGLTFTESPRWVGRSRWTACGASSASTPRCVACWPDAGSTSASSGPCSRWHHIRAHVILCWLALLLIRVAETSTGQTWRTLRRKLDRLHLDTFTSPAGTFHQRTETTTAQKHTLTALALAEPPRTCGFPEPL